MDERLRDAFLAEIGHQLRQAVIATDLVNEGIEGDPDRAWLGISALLTAAANISRILWPKLDRPRTALVDHLGLAGDSPLAQRTLRNHLERADQRIEQWWKKSPQHPVEDPVIGPRSAGAGGPAPFRSFDPSTNVVTFGDDEIDLQALVLELEAVAARVAP
jgi:hypothetical protein